MPLLKFPIVFILCITLCCCGSNKNYPKAEYPLEAGREFIDGCLKGDFERASFYMKNDPQNEQLLTSQKINYDKKTKQEKLDYHEASIIILEDATINDSTHIINYRNSYDKIGRKVKVILYNDVWLVDFKYTFDGNL